MSVTNLDNREKGMNITNREPKGAKKVEDDIARAKRGEPSTDAELEGLRARIEGARTILPEGADRHCSDCAQAFTNGRDAAIKAIEG